MELVFQLIYSWIFNSLKLRKLILNLNLMFKNFSEFLPSCIQFVLNRSPFFLRMFLLGDFVLKCEFQFVDSLLWPCACSQSAVFCL